VVAGDERDPLGRNPALLEQPAQELELREEPVLREVTGDDEVITPAAAASVRRTLAMRAAGSIGRQKLR
jgi:hypothetical protein